MQFVRSIGISLALALVSLGLVASTPSKADAYWNWYGSYYYPYYWNYGSYYYNPGYSWYGNGYYNNYPYYNSYRTYPWGWRW